MKKLLIIISIPFIFSCNASRDDQSKAIEKLLTTANESLAHSKPDSVAISSAIVSVEKFVKDFPKDTLSPAYLFELSLIYQKQQKMDETIAALERVEKEYPESKQAAKSLFLEGFLYANVLNQLDKAKEKYQLYLDKYSAVDAKMTSDVQMELQNLGRSPEEILKQIQEKNAVDTAQAKV
jgi:TolA-binding protein